MYVQNNGKIAFQHVFHVYFHIILKPDEKHGLTIEEWPCIEPPKEELQKVLESVLSKLE